MNWDSFAYQFIVGGFVFFAGIAAAWSCGDYSLKKREDQRILLFLLVIFLVSFVGRLLWQLYGLGFL